MTEMNLIRRIAWSYSYTTSLDIDDLFSIAAIGYTKALNTYDAERSCFSTWAWINMKQELNNHLAGIRPDPHTVAACVKGVTPHDCEEIGPEETVSFKEMVSSMGKEAREVCEIIFESPHEFLIQGKPKLSQGRLRDALRERGWSWPKIRNGMREVKQTLMQMA